MTVDESTRATDYAQVGTGETVFDPVVVSRRLTRREDAVCLRGCPEDTDVAKFRIWARMTLKVVDNKLGYAHANHVTQRWVDGSGGFANRRVTGANRIGYAVDHDEFASELGRHSPRVGNGLALCQRVQRQDEWPKRRIG